MFLWDHSLSRLLLPVQVANGCHCHRVFPITCELVDEGHPALVSIFSVREVSQCIEGDPCGVIKRAVWSAGPRILWVLRCARAGADKDDPSIRRAPTRARPFPIACLA